MNELIISVIETRTDEGKETDIVVTLNSKQVIINIQGELNLQNVSEAFKYLANQIEQQ